MNEDTQLASSQAQAQLDSVVDMVAALECDYDRMEELRELQADCAYSVNWSLIGCLPDGEALFFSDIDDARTAIVDELTERLEMLDDFGGGDADTLADNADAQQRFKDAIEYIETGKDSVVVNGYHFWVASGFEEQGLEADEYKELQELLSEANECADEDEAREAIEQDALSVEVRTGWHTPGSESEPAEYRIVLCTGGPHVEIRGDISQHGEPESAELYYQDWFTGLQRLPTNSAEQDALLTYAGCFIVS